MVGYDIEIKDFPAQRAINLSNEGFVDGEAARLPAIEKNFKNLICIPVPLHEVQVMAFSKDRSLSINSWDSLLPYRFSTLLGYRQVISRTNGMNRQLVGSYEQALKMLFHDHVDIAVLTFLDGKKTLNELGLDNIYVIKPALAKAPLYHYLHKKHKALAPLITKALEDMKQEGRLDYYQSKALLKIQSGQ